MSQSKCNIVVLGSGGVGKSCITVQFVQNVWIDSYDPTIEDSYKRAIQVDGRHVMLEILDTAGMEQYTTMRDLYIKKGQGFLLVFSLTSESSFLELGDLRKEIQRVKEDDHPPIVLVGNKSDLEDDREVLRGKGFQTAQEWGVPYYESSARYRTNIDEVFVGLSQVIMDKIGDGFETSQAGKTHSKSRGCLPSSTDRPRCIIL